MKIRTLTIFFNFCAYTLHLSFLFGPKLPTFKGYNKNCLYILELKILCRNGVCNSDNYEQNKNKVKQLKMNKFL